MRLVGRIVPRGRSGGLPFSVGLGAAVIRAISRIHAEGVNGF